MNRFCSKWKPFAKCIRKQNNSKVESCWVRNLVKSKVHDERMKPTWITWIWLPVARACKCTQLSSVASAKNVESRLRSMCMTGRSKSTWLRRQKCCNEQIATVRSVLALANTSSLLFTTKHVTIDRCNSNRVISRPESARQMQTTPFSDPVSSSSSPWLNDAHTIDELCTLRLRKGYKEKESEKERESIWLAKFECNQHKVPNQ